METIKKTIMDLFDLGNMEPKKAEEMMNSLSTMVFQASLVRALPTLSEEDMTEYEKMLDADREGDELFSYLVAKVPNFGQILEEEAEILRTELANEFQKAGIPE